MIPLSRDELTDWTPPSLANLAGAPSFRLRPHTKRDGRAYNRAYVEAGLTNHSVEDFRAETLKALKDLSSPDSYEIDKARLGAAWDAYDQGIELAEDEQAAITRLSVALTEQWRPLRKMAFDQQEFGADAPKLAIGLLVVGWTNLATPFVRSSGAIPIDTVEDMQAELSKIEAAAVADKVQGVTEGVAFNQLALHVFDAMTLAPGEAGNSASPSPSSTIQNGSTTELPLTAAGSSRAPRTKKTPPAASPPPTAS